jgi:hypothetical protein
MNWYKKTLKIAGDFGRNDWIKAKKELILELGIEPSTKQIQERMLKNKFSIEVEGVPETRNLIEEHELV